MKLDPEAAKDALVDILHLCQDVIEDTPISDDQLTDIFDVFTEAHLKVLIRVLESML